MSELEAQIPRIERLADKWATLMDLGWLSIRHSYNHNFSDISHFIVATTQADWEYRMASIEWYLPRVAGITDQTLEGVVVHEYVHALSNATESVIPAKHAKLVEYTTESIARAILSVHRGNDEAEQP